MKANELLKHVSKAATVVNTGALIPIMKNLLVYGQTITGSDQQASIRVSTPYKLSDDKVAVDTQKLVALLKALKNEEINVDFGFPTTKVVSDSGSYEISAFDGNEYPNLEFDTGGASAKSYLFERALDLTKGSVAADELRPAMTGVYFDTNLGYVVATNGHKLSRYEAKFEGDSFILPTISGNLFKLLNSEDLTYNSSESKITFATEDIVFSLTKMEGNYPPYDKVIPTNNDKSLTVKTSDLINSLKRVQLFSSAETNSVALELGEVVKLKGSDVNYGNSGEEVLEASYQGEPMTIGLNAKYLLDLLQTAGDGSIELTLTEHNKPVLVHDSTNPRLLQLVMPVMI